MNRRDFLKSGLVSLATIYVGPKMERLLGPLQAKHEGNTYIKIGLPPALSKPESVAAMNQLIRDLNQYDSFKNTVKVYLGATDYGFKGLYLGEPDDLMVKTLPYSFILNKFKVQRDDQHMFELTAQLTLAGDEKAVKRLRDEINTNRPLYAKYQARVRTKVKLEKSEVADQYSIDSHPGRYYTRFELTKVYLMSERVLPADDPTGTSDVNPESFKADDEGLDVTKQVKAKR